VDALRRARGGARGDRGPQLTSVFISYRREDSSGYAGRLYDALTDRFGEQQVFMDIDTLQPGADFGEVVDRTLGAADVVIALIGRRWIDAADEHGARRLLEPDDWVRIELAHALARDGTVVIPVLVQGAVMPRADELPDDLRPLALRHAVELTDARWRYDVERLLGQLGRPRGRRVLASPRAKWGVAAAALVTAIAVVAVATGGGGGEGATDPTVGCPNPPATRSFTPAGATPVSIVFANATSGRVQIFWLDTTGSRQRFGVLEPGARRSYNTYPQHAWMARDEADRCLGVYLPPTDGSPVTIRDP
jgi:hypothetical protein